MTSTQSPTTDDSSPQASATPQRRVNRHVRTLIDLVIAVIVGAIVALVALKAIDSVQWPAFNSSNVTRSLTTAGQVVAVAILVIAALLYRYGKARWLVTLLSTAGISGLVTVTLGMPLGATRLYLFGLSADQQFRTEYLTRLTSSPHLADMTYLHLAPYYPAGWFWGGGRYASLMGLPGWEAFKPWAILSMAVAAAIGVVLWTRMVRADRGIATALAVTVVTLMYAGPEPYAAVLIMIGVPMLIPMLYGLRGRSRHADGPTASLRSGTSWAAVVATGLFLGLSATFYTLYTGLFAGVAILMAFALIVHGWVNASNKALPREEVSKTRRGLVLAVFGRLVVMGVISGLIAMTVWAPYLLARLRSEPASGGTAEHYLPERGSFLPWPMFHLSLVGAITFIGLVWILLRFRQRTIAAALGVTVVGIYLMSLLSMLATAAGTTLLGFRLEPILVAVLAAAGVFGVVELAHWAVGRFGDVRVVVGVLAALAAIAVAQSIPAYLSNEITTAYTDTDGYGDRADKRPPGAESYYPQIDKLIGEKTGRPATDNVVLTADYGFLSVYPYWGFQGLTSHYANPLAEFDKRAATIETWSKASSADDLVRQLDAAPWTPPNVFLFRYSADGYALRLAADVYPNDPNVKRYTVTFDPNLFNDPRFEVTDVGPFVLVVRK
ncbi:MULTISPECIES: galactan 5-O-arabinofuranosyltransferase [Gordonia]|uniref:Galactan 5-O-arabinofuranosyltransferase n=1 Tax=Gordonia sputi NBRC 100414 TaxID=1089453 RepID=H5U5M3_9ACTN|nr:MULTISPECIES: galactan 5-O-arabinofuranosyltransferase [Gordonia]NKY94237.1 arabinofuranosyltransferase [Gordonia sputi]OBA71891.1 arabinofuranosyltransferase [Gordonia sp. 852002-10350_SCH5691597]GAB41031.1 arabinosyltransferase AftA [Gordonia sputi NBRC 100414]